MKSPVILSTEAGREFEAAAIWYEQQAALGAGLVDCVQEALDKIGRNPELHAVIYRDIRRMCIRRFPYGIYYRILGDRIEVIALLHDRRNPDVWRSRG